MCRARPVDYLPANRQSCTGGAQLSCSHRASTQSPGTNSRYAPWENLREPERIHVDPFGNLHICQGISIGNLLERSLTEIMRGFDADNHPIVGPLLAGGPAEIVRKYDLAHEDGYADHCHLCYASRCALRERFPDELTPDQMYGDS